MANEDEEFEFRLRAEQEAAGKPAAPVAPPPGVPINPKNDPTPLPQEPTGMERFKRNMLAGPRALETAARIGAGGIGSLAGGALGGLEWLGDRLPGSKPTGATPSSGAEAGAQFANRMLDKTIGPPAERTQDYMKGVAQSKELEALMGMNPMEAAALGSARLPSMPTIKAPNAIPSRVKDVVNQARGNVANEAAESLRTKMVAQSDRMATQAREAQKSATEQATKAGMDAEQAAAWGQAAQKNLENTEKLGAAIDQKLLERPNMSKEEFGGMLRAAAKSLHETKSAERMKASGYSTALQQDAHKLVNTAPVRAVIEENEKGIANPTLRATLDSIKSELQPHNAPAPIQILGPDGKPLSKLESGLPLQNADSLRKYLDGIIETKQVKVGNSSMAVDKESLRAVKAIRDAHVQAMDAASPALKDARKKWADLSRGELDRLEGKGDLAKTLSSDSLSGEYKLTEAEVAGAIIRRANAGSDSLAMLAKTQPGLKEAGRLYFTGELFGKGAVPTPGVLATFVKNNERSLKQLGLYDEFKDLASAQRARQTALEGAREDVKTSGQAQSTAERLQGAAQRTADQKQRLGDKYSTFQTEIANVPGKDLPGKIKSFGKDMVQEGLITQDEYGQMIRDADALGLQYDNAAAKKALLLKIGAYLGLGAAGTYGAKHALGI